MFKQDSQSIQQLLVAEKRSEERVAQARKRKIMRLKQAKEDAMAEIQILRDEREKQFKEYESKYLGSQESCVLKIEKETDKSLKEMEKYVRLNKDMIIECLLSEIYDIESEVHENFRIDAF